MQNHYVKEEVDTLLENAKARLLELCTREVQGQINHDVSVLRYNMAREELKLEFPWEVIGRLDASGFIKTILCEDEKVWLRKRKEKSLSPMEWERFLKHETKGGQR